MRETNRGDERETTLVVKKTRKPLTVVDHCQLIDF